MEIATDTATLAIYDLECLKHRLEDFCDWWCDPEEGVKDINAGNILFINTGSDGFFDVEISEELPHQKNTLFKAIIKNVSGTFFFGKGDCVTGEESEPDDWDGDFKEYPIGTYAISVWLDSDVVKLHLALTEAPATNEFSEFPSIV